MHWCTELCDSPAQLSSRKIVLVSKPVCLLKKLTTRDVHFSLQSLENVYGD